MELLYTKQEKTTLMDYADAIYKYDAKSGKS